MHSKYSIWAVGFPGGKVVKESTCQCQRYKKMWVPSLGWEDPWRRKWQPTPVFLPGESHGQRRLAGYTPWGQKRPTWLNTHAQSVPQYYPTLSDPTHCSTPGFPVYHQLLKLAQTHVHWVMPSNHLILCPLLLACLQSFPASGSFLVSQFFTSGGQVLELQLQHQSFQWIFRTDFL